MTETEIAMWLSVTSASIAAISFLRDHLATRNERETEQRGSVDKGLIALREAASHTERYIDSRREGAERNTKIELELENLWYAVYVAMRNINEPLARRFRLKAGYWRDPEQWSEQTVTEAGIGLKRIVLEADFLLHQVG
ncbi:hypothetical protein CfE428DRAFT_4739 [Chthoniobacter flavus Ellin428]|uniref:Uncharacterized protein n=1 Tax=Chthoniobacter flavus Ellin428 TaxID=497964 RepID=B4D749_9BACT|nr:hypothetical protein [Chthoniobacter flavus]EDY17700.1 hypothetical protein CfE428DRAFT_4739 [Chthoniobacter flavus Ellin428]TCO87026.1 hypothetical protein EV701_1243 [Chthoniobacter flavus]